MHPLSAGTTAGMRTLVCRGVRMLAVALVLAFPVVLSSCGGDESSSNDIDTVRELLSSSASVQRAMQPLYSCLPEERRCYTQAGPEVVEVVEREQARFESALAETDDECLTEAGELYRESLEAYGDAGQAAVDVRPAEVDAAIDRSTEAELGYLKKFDECGFSQGRFAEVGPAMRAVDADLLRLGNEAADCKAIPCIEDVAGRMEAKAVEGGQLLERMIRELSAEEEAPECLAAALRQMNSGYQALVVAARALQTGDYDEAEREGTRASELTTAGQEAMATCLGSITG